MIDQTQVTNLVAILIDFYTSNEKDICLLDLDDLGHFTISCTWMFVKFSTLDIGGSPTHWNNSTITECFGLASLLNWLPTRVNLDVSGANVDSILDSLCNQTNKFVDHLFVVYETHVSFVATHYLLVGCSIDDPCFS